MCSVYYMQMYCSHQVCCVAKFMKMCSRAAQRERCLWYDNTCIRTNTLRVINSYRYNQCFQSAVLISVSVLVQSTKSIDFKFQFQSPGNFQSRRRTFAEFQLQFQSPFSFITQVSHQNECDHTRLFKRLFKRLLTILLNTGFDAITQYAVRTAVG